MMMMLCHGEEEETTDESLNNITHQSFHIQPLFMQDRVIIIIHMLPRFIFRVLQLTQDGNAATVLKGNSGPYFPMFLCFTNRDSNL